MLYFLFTSKQTSLLFADLECFTQSLQLKQQLPRYRYWNQSLILKTGKCYVAATILNNFSKTGQPCLDLGKDETNLEYLLFQKDSRKEDFLKNLSSWVKI